MKVPETPYIRPKKSKAIRNFGKTRVEKISSSPIKVYRAEGFWPLKQVTSPTKLYVDASTYYGKDKKPYSRICVHDGISVVFESSIGHKTINESEMMAISKAIELLGETGGTIYSDSQLAVNMINRTWKGQLQRLKDLRDTIIVPDTVELFWIPRDQNFAGLHFEGKL